jgi:hypothetical protein
MRHRVVSLNARPSGNNELSIGVDISVEHNNTTVNMQRPVAYTAGHCDVD